jgi:uncharacterized protein (TIGR02996 family)
VERALSTFRSRLLANPDDRSLRQVYADLLIDRGDVRGQFIQAQCMGLDDAAAALLVAHVDHLKHPLGRHADVVFRGGFIEEWTTDYLEYRQAGRQLFRTSPMRTLRITGLRKHDLKYVFETAGLSNLVELHLLELASSPFAHLARTSLPRLRTLVVTGRFRQTALDPFLRTPLAQQLEHVRIDGSYGDERVALLRD